MVRPGEQVRYIGRMDHQGYSQEADVFCKSKSTIKKRDRIPGLVKYAEKEAKA